MQRLTLVAAAIAVTAQLMTLRAEVTAYRVDPARSQATIHVGKAGLLSFAAGHTHEVTGPIQSGSVDVDLDAPARSRVQLVIAASALKVSAAGEPEGDAPKVQDVMESDKVLDIRRYPMIAYESTSVALKTRRANSLDFSVTGRLTIRGVTQPVAAPVHVELSDSGLTATGRFEIKQSTFGIKPISVAGVVAVKDELQIDFTVVANR